MYRLGLPVCSLALTSLLWNPFAWFSRSPQAPTTTAAQLAADRDRVIARARVWEPTDVRSMNLLVGPGERKPFEFDETVTCTWIDRKLTGNTPKFDCLIPPDDEVKVKIGGDNGEVYAEVAATRLLWALGFGADAMYSTRVVCTGCPETVSGIIERGEDVRIFDPAAIERKLQGSEIEGGWAWNELDKIDENAGGASRAERDALRLLAVFIQHTDSKPVQQRLTCRDKGEHEKDKGEHEKNAAEKVTEKDDHLKGKDHHKSAKGEREKSEAAASSCEHPFMYLNDLGVTFGRANRWNEGASGSMNLVEWSRTPVWRDPERCVGNLPKSYTGTLDNPVISEEGRQLLAKLLGQLSDRQIHDLFAAARVELRLRNPENVSSGFPTIDDWVAAFKAKREQITGLRCSTS